MKLAALIAGAIASAVALPASAQFYVGGGFGQAKAKDWCAQAGGISCGYTNLGEFKASAGGLSDNAKVNAWELSALAAWPLMNQFAVYGRLGAYRANVKEETNFVGNFEHTNTDLTYGLGGQYDFTRNFGLRVEWQRYAKVGGGDVAFGPNPGDKSDVDVLGLSALWRF